MTKAIRPFTSFLKIRSKRWPGGLVVLPYHWLRTLIKNQTINFRRMAKICSWLNYIMNHNEGKLLTCTKYTEQNAENFNIINFYEYFNFISRSHAESSLKGSLINLKKKAKKNRHLHNVITRLEKNDYEV